MGWDLFGVPCPAQALESGHLDTRRGPCLGAGETDTLGRGSDGTGWYNLTNTEFSLPLRAPSRLAATRRHVATCHILALQVLMRQKGLRLFWKTSWRRGEGKG